MKFLPFTICVFILASVFSVVNAQLKVSYGITAGVSVNKCNTSKDYYIPQYFNAHYIEKENGFTSPILGLQVNANYKLLYLASGLTFNKLQESYYNYSEHGYFKTENQQTTIHMYYVENITKYIAHKINIPLEVGLQFLPKRTCRPFLFSGINMNYIFNAQINKQTNSQDPQTQVVNTQKESIDFFDSKDNFEFNGRRIKFQFMAGAGLQVGKRILMRMALQQGNNLTLTEKMQDQNYWNCFINSYSLRNVEKTLSFTYLLSAH